MTGVSILNQIIAILVGGIEGISTGIGTGLSTLATSIFLETTTVDGVSTTNLSTFGILVCVFAGISLAIGLSRLVVRWISTLGGSNV